MAAATGFRLAGRLHRLVVAVLLVGVAVFVPAQVIVQASVGPTRANLPAGGLDAGEDFRQAAFRLLPNPDEYFSDAVLGEDYVYIIALEEHIDSRVPDYEEVAEDVRKFAEADALTRTLIDKGQEVREAVQEALEEGESFSEAVESFDLEATKADDVSAATGIEDVLQTMMVRSISEPPVRGSSVSGYSVIVSTTSPARSPHAMMMTMSTDE